MGCRAGRRRDQPQHDLVQSHHSAKISLSKIDDTLVLSNTADPVTISGPGASQVTVSGNSETGLFQIGAGVTASISGLTLSGSFASYSAVVDLGTLSLSSCTLSGNTAAGPGGGLYVGLGASATVSGCTFSKNTGTSGGGVYVMGSATLSGCTLSGNTATSAGGAIANAGDTTVTACSITGNSGFFGAGFTTAAPSPSRSARSVATAAPAAPASLRKAPARFPSRPSVTTRPWAVAAVSTTKINYRSANARSVATPLATAGPSTRDGHGVTLRM